MMEAGEEFDVVHFRSMINKNTPMEISKQIEWENHMMDVFREYGCNVDLRYNDYAEDLAKRIKEKKRNENYDPRIGYPFGAFIFEQMYDTANQCYYRITRLRACGRYAKIMGKQGIFCYFGQLLGENTTFIKYKDNNVLEYFIFPFQLYTIEYEDILNVITSHGYELPPCPYCCCCGGMSKAERDKVKALEPDVIDRIKHLFYDFNPTWIEDKCPINNGWYYEIFGISEMDYPKRENKWYPVSKKKNKIKRYIKDDE